MTQLTWTEDLNTGIAEIDLQHRRIVSYINHLDEARQNHDRMATGNVINDLIDYTLSHFAFEEELMAQAGYPFTGPHKRVHDAFARRVGEFQLRYQAGEDISGELHALLLRWLVGHIKNDDAAYTATVMAHTQAKARRRRNWLVRMLDRVVS